MPTARRLAAVLTMVTILVGCTAGSSPWTPPPGVGVTGGGRLPTARPSAPTTDPSPAAATSSAPVAPTIAPAASVTTDPAGIVASQELQVLVVGTQLYPGENHLLIDLLNRDGRRLARSDPEVELRIGAPGTEPDIPLEVEVVKLADDSRPLFRAIVSLDEPGRWTIAATARIRDRQLAGDDWFDVLPDGDTLPLGAAVPALDTPTAFTAETVAAISSNPAPDPFFYERSVAEALAEGIPFAFVIDSYAFRTSEACGGGLGHLIHLHGELPELAMIHAEPFVTSYADGVLALDPVDGPPRLAAWSEAFGIQGPPWTFIVDGQGRLRGKFEGIVGSDELRSVMQAVLAEG